MCQDCLKVCKVLYVHVDVGIIAFLFTQRGICVKTLSSHFWSQFVTKGYEAAKHWIAKVWLY